MSPQEGCPPLECPHGRCRRVCADEPVWHASRFISSSVRRVGSGDVREREMNHEGVKARRNWEKEHTEKHLVTIITDC
jgi:hypothetical protein